MLLKGHHGAVSCVDAKIPYKCAVIEKINEPYTDEPVKPVTAPAPAEATAPADDTEAPTENAAAEEAAPEAEAAPAEQPKPAPELQSRKELPDSAARQ